MKFAMNMNASAAHNAPMRSRGICTFVYARTNTNMPARNTLTTVTCSRLSSTTASLVVAP
jgi:hypothetical protein